MEYSDKQKLLGSILDFIADKTYLSYKLEWNPIEGMFHCYLRKYDNVTGETIYWEENTHQYGAVVGALRKIKSDQHIQSFLTQLEDIK
jgi:hypothetical protein